jgi:hypothetical protein
MRRAAAVAVLAVSGAIVPECQTLPVNTDFSLECK